MNFEQRFNLIYKDLLNTDTEELASIYHDDIIFVDPITTHQGLAAVKAYFARLLTSTEACEFDIHLMQDCRTPADANYDYLVEWTMRLTLKNQSRLITVDGVSVLKLTDDKIIYHRDYYDLGEMVYEHIPLLKQVIHFVKKKLNS
ncbi:nuclear transport factor 2 family protein [Alteromonas lipolytica]|uniref:SnoaL-like domain-containing protein n=1 Tax=Alteromonas lipolytica TaxID=1856405 RepID=A0A1E8FAE6_9ALTE|nr:nuclear transport factor 2 family protein [Alteromonas lipolytica]OFI32483.1 hypothetical protein BFC17_04775 [Alteromonas lipolytica]GGF75793.1 transcriptional regulator [Alteromonas lipolytica]